MELRFEDEALERLAYDTAFRSKRWHPTLVRATRKRLLQIQAAPDERTIRNIAGAHLEQLHGERAGTSSIRVDRQYRLIVRFVTDEHTGRTAVIIELVDYHP